MQCDRQAVLEDKPGYDVNCVHASLQLCTLAGPQEDVLFRATHSQVVRQRGVIPIGTSHVLHLVLQHRIKCHQGFAVHETI